MQFIKCGKAGFMISGIVDQIPPATAACICVVAVLAPAEHKLPPSNQHPYHLLILRLRSRARLSKYHLTQNCETRKFIPKFGGTIDHFNKT